MKYFGYKQNLGYGFFEEMFEGAAAISDEKWQELLNEQSAGKDIVMYNDEVFASEKDLFYLDTSGWFQKRTEAELNELKEINQVILTNNTALNYLNDTDWKVIRHRDQQVLGIETSLTEEEYQQLLIERQNARDLVVRGGIYDIIE